MPWSTHLNNYAGKDVTILQSCLNEDLQNIIKWLIANKLKLNTTKTEFVLIGSRQNCISCSEYQWYSGKPGVV